MKAGDKISTDSGVVLVAGFHDPGHVCNGCYFHNDGECMMDVCGVNIECEDLIFKEEEYIDAYNNLHGDCSKYYLKSNYKIQPSIINFYVVFDVRYDTPTWVRCFYGLRKAVNYVLMRDKRERL